MTYSLRTLVTSLVDRLSGVLSLVLIILVTASTACTAASNKEASRDSQDLNTEQASTGGNAGGNTVGTDELNRDDFGLPLPTDTRYARRVVSLNPTATEVIFAIGADSLLVGRSRWDEYPAQVATIPSVGDGIRPSVETVLSVQPTLVILYATADNRAAAEALQRAGVRTVALRVDRIEQFFTLTKQLGVMLGPRDRAQLVADSIRTTLDRVGRATAAISDKPSVVWPLWESPPMVVGGGSYLDELLSIAGARNVFHDSTNPSPGVSTEEIARRSPQFVITSPERARTLEKSSAWRALDAVRDKRFLFADQTLTGRPSVTLGMAAVHLARLIHPVLADSMHQPLPP